MAFSETRTMNQNPRSQNDAVWATNLGARLRALQASFADDPAEERQRYLAEELGRALQEVPLSERPARLHALAERFPVWDNSGAASRGMLAVEETPEELVRRLVAMGPQLSEEQRAALARELAAGGFPLAPAQSTSLEPIASGELPAELQKRLGLEPEQVLDTARVLRLIAALVECMVTLDYVAWNVWKKLTPQSLVRRDPGATGDFRKLAASFLLGDPEVNNAQINQCVDKTRQLIAALLAAIGATGENFARQFLARFSPVTIRTEAEAEPGFFLGPEQKCWRRYNALFNETSGVAIEQEIAKIVVKYVESLITGAGSVHALKK